MIPGMQAAAEEGEREQRPECAFGPTDGVVVNAVLSQPGGSPEEEEMGPVAPEGHSTVAKNVSWLAGTTWV